MNKYIIPLIFICTFCQIAQGANRHVYDKLESAENGCRSHRLNVDGLACNSPSPGFFRFYHNLHPYDPDRGRYYFTALMCLPGTSFIGSEGFWWDNDRGPFPHPQKPYCSTDIPDLDVELGTSAQQPIALFPGESLETTLSFSNLGESANYEEPVTGGIFLSRDNILDDRDTPLISTPGHQELIAGQTVTHDQPITIPPATLSGDYFIIGAVNPKKYFEYKNGEVPLPAEDDFENNVSEPISIEVKQPRVEIEICVGNPISTNSGRKLETEIDYQGAGPFPLQFARYYNSQPGNIKGWNATYSRHLIVLDKDSRTDAILVFDDGQRYEFPDIDEQGYSDPDVAGLITRTTDGFNYLDEAGTTHQFDHEGRLAALISRTGLTQTLHYAGDQLIQISDQYGKSLHLAYNTNGQIETLTTPDNRVYHYHYNGNDLLSTVILPDATPANLADNPRREYLYDSVNLTHGLTGIIDENGNHYSTFDYDSEGRAILSTHDSGADRNSIVYGENDTTVTNALGKETTYVFEEILGSKRLARVEGHPTVNCPATTTTRIYDARGSVTEEVDANGKITRYTYTHTGLPLDEHLYHVGLVTRRTEAAGTSEARTTTITWHPNFRLPTLISEPARQVALNYGDNTRLIQRTETALDTGATRGWVYQYDTAGLLAGIDGPRVNVSDVTSLAYNSQGELTHITNALGQTTTIIDHDANGLPTTVQDPNGLVTHLVYDERLRLTSQRVISDAGEARTRITYDNKGNVVAITLADGQTLHYQYDVADRLVQINNNLGEVINFSVDADGNRTTEITRDASNAIVRVQNRVFDELGRLITTIGAASQHTRFGYDNNDNLDFIEDPQGRQTHLNFDALDRLIKITDALQGNSTFTYDARENVTSVTDAEGVATRFTYDGLNNLIAEISAARGATSYQYDTAGNRTGATDANGVTMVYAYDALNRLTHIQYIGSPQETITYTYDQDNAGIGQLTGSNDKSGSTTFSYDNRGNLLTDHRLIDGVGYTTRYAYNLASQLTQMTYPSGRIVHYQLDSISRVTAITTQASAASPIEPIASGFGYLPFGPALSWRQGNNLTTSIGYDHDFRVTSIDVEDEQDPEQIMSLSYGYNDVSNITRILDNSGINNQTFDYDELNRLTSASGNYGGIDYRYDGVGNRLGRTLTKDGEVQTESYQYENGSHKLQSVSTTDSDGSATRSFTHDANGNTTSDISNDRDLGMVIDARNRLSEIIRDGESVGEYTYNALGQRVARTASYRGRLHAQFDESNMDDAAVDSGDSLHVTTDNKKINETLHFHYDQLGNLIAESDEQGEPIREYIYLGNFRIAMAATSIEQGSAQPDSNQPLALYYIHNDHLGTANKVTDTEQHIVWSMEQTPFGEVTLTTEAILMPMRFPGQYADLESGYSYNYFRDYDPTLGRYVQSDPIGLEGGVNTYFYVDGNPILFSDQFGLRKIGKPGEADSDGVGRSKGRFGVFGCILGCASFIEGDKEAQISIEPTIGGGIMVCSSPSDSAPSQQSCPLSCGIYDPNCDNKLNLSGSLTKGGAGIGFSNSSDGSTCVLIGPFVSGGLFGPTLNLGGTSE